MVARSTFQNVAAVRGALSASVGAQLARCCGTFFPPHPRTPPVDEGEARDMWDRLAVTLPETGHAWFHLLEPWVTSGVLMNWAS